MIVQAGRDVVVVHGDVHLRAGRPFTMRYRVQVEQIAPADLVGREVELAELAAFTTRADSSYVCWRGEAWSGKTALMSWFVLHPPPGVHVVSFFITARLPGQSDRTAFVDSVAEQLAALLGLEPPAHPTAATKEVHLLGLLDEASRACHERGEHLVLVVDGLDEDRGVTTGPDAHSIAALLPVRLPPGLHVVVSGRPNPPVPADVPDDHPLRSPGATRPLSPSAEARTIQAALDREVRRLAAGGVERDLLGLVTAAGGGLTAADLAELTGLSRRQVEHHLRTVTGRTFTRRANLERPDGSEVYLLGHEELQVTATELLDDRLPTYRVRLHDWAQTHRVRGWPDDTPSYLLGGYFTTLLAEGDLDRAVTLATDVDRRHRQREVYGGHSRAIVELDATHDALAASTPPDLTSMLRLAVHRHNMSSHYLWDSERLPIVWALLGQVDRAVSIARSMPDRSYEAGYRASALIEVAAVVPDRERARGLLDEAERIVEYLCASTDLGDYGHRYWKPFALAALRVGDSERAFGALGRVTGAAHVVDALCAVVTELGPPHDREPVATLLDRAEAAARNDADPAVRIRRLRAVVEASATVGDIDRAEHLTRSVPNRAHRAQLWLSVAKGVAARGDLERAGRILDHVEHIIAAMSGLRSRAWAWPDLITAAATACDHSRVERVIIRARHEMNALAAEARAADVMEDHEDAGDDEFQGDPKLLATFHNSLGMEYKFVVKLADALCEVGRADEALSVSLDCLHYEMVKKVLPAIARAEAEAGRFDFVERLFDELPFHEKGDSTRLAVAEVAARRGDGDRARTWLRATDTPERFATLHTDWESVVVTTATAGRFDLLTTIIDLVEHPRGTGLWRTAAVAASNSGHYEQAVALLDRITDLAHETGSTRALLDVVRLACHLGFLDRAEETAELIGFTDAFNPTPPHFLEAWIAIAKAWAQAGRPSRALTLLRHVRQTMTDGEYSRTDIEELAEAWFQVGGVEAVRALRKSLPPNPDTDEYLAMLIAVEAARAGRTEEAVAAARSLTATALRAEIQIALADSATERGEFDRAEEFARQVKNYRWVDCIERLAKALLLAGQRERAEALVRSTMREHSAFTALRALMVDPDPTRKAGAIATLLRLGLWTEVLGELATVRPAALDALTDELVRMSALPA
ncbi:MAG: hypothetical protein HOY78_46540 [Saccharothrix sp.]|nr:hypothetical protein [Saccharothrix sp.]